MVTRRKIIGGIAGIIAAQTAPAFGLAGAAGATSPRARSLITARNMTMGADNPYARVASYVYPVSGNVLTWFYSDYLSNVNKTKVVFDAMPLVDSSITRDSNGFCLGVFRSVLGLRGSSICTWTNSTFSKTIDNRKDKRTLYYSAFTYNPSNATRTYEIGAIYDGIDHKSGISYTSAISPNQFRFVIFGNTSDGVTPVSSTQMCNPNSVRLYGAQAYVDDVEVYRLIPVVTKDGRGALYETHTKRLLTPNNGGVLGYGD